MKEPFCIEIHDTNQAYYQLFTNQKIPTCQMTLIDQKYKNGNPRIPHNIFIASLVRASFKACS